MTTDDRRPFLRRLFTRRLEEASAALSEGPPGYPAPGAGADPAPPAAAAPKAATDEPVPPEPTTFDPASARPVPPVPAAADPASFDPASSPPSPPAADHAGFDPVARGSTSFDRDPSDRDALDSSGGRAAGHGAAPPPPSGRVVPAQRSGADDVTAASRLSPVVSGTSAGSAEEPLSVGPTGSAPLPASAKSEMSVRVGEPASQTEADAEAAAEFRLRDGHVPSFLDADFDEGDAPETPDSSAPTARPAAAGGFDGWTGDDASPTPVGSARGPDGPTDRGGPEHGRSAEAAPRESGAEPPAGPPGAEPAGAPGTEPAGAPGAEPARAPEAEPARAPEAEPARAPGAEPARAPGAEPAGGSDAEPAGGRVDELGGPTPAGASAPASPRASAAPRRPEIGEWRGIVLVTGTDTDVGKTIATAAVAAAAQASGLRVAVIKPGQTGTVTGAPTDIEVITRLAAPDTVRTLAEYPEPMAPLAAATIAEMPPLELYEVVDAIRTEADKHDLVLVEGAGGLLVPMGVRPSGAAWTLADLATTLGVGALIVARAGLGTLNHTALTLEALERRGVPTGVIIGAWPADPDLVHWANLSELVPHLVGALPEGAGRMDPGVFRRSAPGWLIPALYGVLDNWRVWAEESG